MSEGVDNKGAGTDSRRSTAQPPAPNALGPWDALRTVAAQLLIVSDAQFTIWKMKALRIAALSFLAIPFVIAIFGLAVYGFVLLDSAAAAALSSAHLGDWASPLIRGGAYFGFAGILMFSFWRSHIGSGDSES